MWAIDPAFAIGLLLMAIVAPPLAFAAGAYSIRERRKNATARKAAAIGDGPAPGADRSVAQGAAGPSFLELDRFRPVRWRP
jgi:hypothetical protein